MLAKVLLYSTSAYFGYMLSILLDQGFTMLLEQTSRRIPKKRTKSFRSIGVEDRISALPDDLLVHILSLVPTKDAVATMILSKRWRFIWTMVPKLYYLQTNDGTYKVVIGGLLGRLFGKSYQQRRRSWRFIDESLKAHQAPVLEQLAIEVGPEHAVDANDDVGKWVEKAVESKVRELGLILSWSAENTSLPSSLYTCDTLVALCLCNKILVDVPSLACLPSLKDLGLYSVVYKDEDSLPMLLSCCPVLKHLYVERHHKDNVKIFKIKAPLLECLSYKYVKLGSHYEGIEGTLVIDSPALRIIFITDYSTNSCSIENKPRLDKAIINVLCYPDGKFMTSLSSVTYYELDWSFASLAWFNTVHFSQLMDCRITLRNELDWLEPLMHLLQNSPNLKVLFIDKTFIQRGEKVPLSWNQPSSVPGCLSTHLEIFEWKGYGGRKEEKEFVRYMFANSNCLKRAGFYLKSNRKKKVRKELESMPRVSTSSQLLFSTQLEYLSVEDEFKD